MRSIVWPETFPKKKRQQLPLITTNWSESTAATSERRAPLSFWLREKPRKEGIDKGPHQMTAEVPNRKIEFWYEFASTYSYLSAMHVRSSGRGGRGGGMEARSCSGRIFHARLGYLAIRSVSGQRQTRMVRDVERTDATAGVGIQNANAVSAEQPGAARLRADRPRRRLGCRVHARRLHGAVRCRQRHFRPGWRSPASSARCSSTPTGAGAHGRP